MRIGEVNKDNYKTYLQLLGVKDSKQLDNLFEKDKQVREKDFSFEARAARMVASGYVMEGMIVREDDDGSWKKIVPVPDRVKQAVLDYERQTFITNGNGMVTAKQGDEVSAIIKNYVKTLPPEERLSATWTLARANIEEAQRIVDYLKSRIPGWKCGMRFDTSILTETNFGLDDDRLDVKA